VGTAQSVEVELLGLIDPLVSEVSGIIRTSDARIFVIGDSGNPATLFELNETGEIIHKIEIPQAVNMDWEELQLDEYGTLFIGDIGNNLGYRTDLKIYRVTEFETKMNQDTIFNFETIHYTYSDQETNPLPDNNTSFDCEAMIVLNDQLHFFSKDHGNSGQSKHYSLPTTAGSHMATLIDSLPRQSWITGAALDHLHNMIYFVSDSSISSYNPVTKKQGAEITINAFQLEGICFYADNQFLLTEDTETEPESHLYSLIIEAEGQMLSTIFPNPNDERILYARSNAQINSIEIVDYLGKALISQNWSRNIGSVHLNLHTIASGTYLLRLITDLDVQVHKLILR
jgi:hypothetical protein